MPVKQTCARRVGTVGQAVGRGHGVLRTRGRVNRMDENVREGLRESSRQKELPAPRPRAGRAVEGETGAEAGAAGAAPGQNGEEEQAGMPTTNGSPSRLRGMERNHPIGISANGSGCSEDLGYQSCFGRSCILMTSSFLTILSGSHGDFSKCMPDMQFKAPQQ